MKKNYGIKLLIAEIALIIATMIGRFLHDRFPESTPLGVITAALEVITIIIMVVILFQKSGKKNKKDK